MHQHNFSTIAHGNQPTTILNSNEDNYGNVTIAILAHGLPYQPGTHRQEKNRVSVTRTMCHQTPETHSCVHIYTFRYQMWILADWNVASTTAIACYNSDQAVRAHGLFRGRNIQRHDYCDLYWKIRLPTSVTTRLQLPSSAGAMWKSCR